VCNSRRSLAGRASRVTAEFRSDRLFGVVQVQQFINGFMFTAGGVAAFLIVFAVAAFCELVSKLVHESGRTEIRNAIVDNAAALCALSERMTEARSQYESK
jgi:hypothetical protein